ncbi:type I restriction endonuclease subunit R [Microbacterium sp. NPDC003461]
MAQHNEIEYEREICEYLEANGWLYSRDDKGYDRTRALYPEDVFAWLKAANPDALARVIKLESKDVEKQKAQLLDRLAAELDKSMTAGGGTLNVLRNGFKFLNSGQLQVAQFKPETTLNAAALEKYEGMRLRVVRQVHYAPGDNRSIDLVFFVNGLPVATAELKTENTQSIENAKNQYKRDRLPKEKNGATHALLGFGTRALVHFAVSEDEVWMTTKLDGERTHFLPFNRGTEDGGAGNPLNPDGWKTWYLWERVFQKDALLAILGRFMYVKHESRIDPKTGKTTKTASLRFPRFHQWEAVEKLGSAVAEEGVGKRYLIQHSAGSGKTDSIAWTAHRMARLQVDNQKVFDSVIVVTDRTVLDAQLQDAVRQLDKQDIVVTVDEKTTRAAGTSKSGVLAQALATGKLVIVVTIQTFPFVLEEVRKNKGLKGKRFAVIADEAHSSQSGQVAAKLKAVLSADEAKELEDGGEIDIEAVLAAEMSERANSENISFFAFTATPKSKTLELFGRVPDGGDKPEPFHLYTMKQAIEEGFIIDVLRGYHSFKMIFELGEKAAGGRDHEVDQARAAKEIMQWVRVNPQTISQKAAVIVEHFSRNVAHLLEGEAKAMVVAPSRKAAVRYKLAIDEYIAKKGLGYKTLVAFSGSVVDEESGPDEFTEASMNPGAGDLREAFRDENCRVMIVANKFQTGFDQPLLCAMYVDKQLSGITAVQTLSRLNRTHVTRGGVVKDASMTQVVDFVNDPKEIQAAFEPYFVGAHVEETTDPNLVHDLLAKLDMAGIYTQDEVEQTVNVMLTEGVGAGSKVNSKLAAVLGPAKDRFRGRWQAAVDSDDKVERELLELFRKDVGSFIRLYDFMSQVFDYGDTDIAKKHIYLRLLAPHLRTEQLIPGIDFSDIELTKLQLRDEGKVDVSLTGGEALKPVGVGGGEARDPKMVALAEVLQLLNERFGHPDAHNESWLQEVTQSLLDDKQLVTQARTNTPTQFADSPDFEDALTAAVTDTHESHAKLVDFFFSTDPATAQVKKALLRYFYEAARGEAA